MLTILGLIKLVQNVIYLIKKEEMNKKLLCSFSAISLAGLQAKSELMERKESKYLLHVNQLQKLLVSLQKDYDILEINNIREFTYKNVYFDTDDLFFYHQHLQQTKSRTKVRTRKYVDSHLDFIEYKQKMKNVIKKERVSIGEDQFGQLTPETVEFLQNCFSKYYQLKKKFVLKPVLGNTYKRITLCHKTKEERVTIDTQVSYEDIGGHTNAKVNLAHLAIIECKHSGKKTSFDELMNELTIPEIHLCSKYCLGAYYLGKTSEYQTFLPTIMYIQALQQSTTLSRNFVQDYQERITANKRVRKEADTIGSATS